MSVIQRSIQVGWQLRVFFTEDVFALANPVLKDALADGTPRKVLVVLEDALAQSQPKLERQIENYFSAHAKQLQLVRPPLFVAGGEQSKNSITIVTDILSQIDRHHIDRQSYLLAVGGGALLDVAGFAAATAHRGVRHVRIPTTTLSQADSGVGVKNGINAFGKKNFVGTFAPPHAVINDFNLLTTLKPRDKRSGYVEAVKVACIRDKKFFDEIERDSEKLISFEPTAMKQLIRRCAELHLEHIATSGDPFETGSARPLDFGHWAAHKLEQLSNFQIPHGEAVAIGLALDVIYSRIIGLLDEKPCERILRLLEQLGFNLSADELLKADADEHLQILAGLEEFREHLGGELTVTLLKEIGCGVEVHEMNPKKIVEAIHELRQRAGEKMNRLAVINVVGLTESLIGEHTPRIAEFRKRGALAHVAPAFPAVTCTAQSNYLTGKLPSEHGIVGNGWFNREFAETQFWKQSNHVVRGQKIWDALRARFNDSTIQRFTTANCFWWFNMYSSVDFSITPRPMYPADGRKFFDVYSWPYSIREEIKKDLGEFPFFSFWGPAAGIDSPQGKADAASRWIAESAKWIENKYAPTLNLIYLPHLDYNLQRHGTYAEGRAGNPLPADGTHGVTRPTNPKIHRDLRAIDSIVGDLIDFFGKRGVQVVLLSEYGITNVDTPVHLNRIFRERGWLTVKGELGLEILDAGASKVFAVADHQVAHIYLNDVSLEKSVREVLEKTPGVEKILGHAEKIAAGIDHPRAGDLIAVARENAWFTYYYWLDDARAPDFARTVDIHRKPGYDPVELFLDPKIPAVKLKIAWRLLQKKLGLRMLMDVIPLDATLVKGSHGRRPADKKDWPVFITSQPEISGAKEIESTDVFQILLRQILG